MTGRVYEMGGDLHEHHDKTQSDRIASHALVATGHLNAAEFAVQHA